MNGSNRTSRIESKFFQLMARNHLRNIKNVGFHKGRNLAPFFFYTPLFNDLPNSLKLSKPLMFADDTNLACTGQNPSEIEI